MEKVKITIIGAGVVGLAVARQLSERFTDIFVIEKNSSFGQETSSRNSEVIHAGIHYPKNSLKHKTCIEGNILLYEFCAKYNVAFKRTGKLIVAADKGEIPGLERVYRHGVDNGVPGLKILSKDDVRKYEPNIKAESAIHSPSTGILDSHSFMKALVNKFSDKGGRIAYSTEVIGIDRIDGSYIVTTKGGDDIFRFSTDIVINCAGLKSDKVAEMVGQFKKEYELKYCKGDYFRVNSSKARLVSALVYPVPKEGGPGLGIHATPDLAGGLRLGPDSEYIAKGNISYGVDPLKRIKFYESTHTFLTFIDADDLTPDTAGIRPKLQGPGEDIRDFLIKEESDSGLEGFINLVGIESPGLTGALSIAKYVENLVLKHTKNR